MARLKNNIEELQRETGQLDSEDKVSHIGHLTIQGTHCILLPSGFLLVDGK